MLEAPLIAGSLVAGALCGAAVLTGFGARVNAATPQLGRLSLTATAAQHLRNIRARLSSDIERAGWGESPERILALAFALSGCLSVLGASTAAALTAGVATLIGGLGFLAGFGIPMLALRSAIARRRRRLEGELVPLLELFTLELSGGGSAVSALGSVTMQVQGELASDLRRLLIASQVSGSASFETRLNEYAEHLEIAAIGSLATILAASREYGTGAVHGARALATDLRRAQRRELIAHSRRALNHVLLPAAVGVLLPFLGVLMFPAVSALQRNLR